ncbi:hypothetical protein A5787_14280 [Mycobacterium sp. 852002-50816_SCH5313054-b]|uniref:helix-turn-helix domain-containing protein n=1 Tax=Mycobacterium sp. 852002-50816_SCH5313054-b TaxID=1834092 RepID=UPI000802228A|nr:helix-turn-helix domain-containing protein [Mycobacterium sp. 852002-50816_SCH5313054-b]OBF43917.1 hypothetical protein A5787_14280 [Mycobacterium sp. 852002-50816_SCH5313054-b]
MSQYLNVREVADALGVTYQHVLRLIKAGEIPAIKIGAAIRVPRSVLDALEHEAYVDSLLEKAPPLTEEQRTKLAEVLKPVRQ